MNKKNCYNINDKYKIKSCVSPKNIKMLAIDQRTNNEHLVYILEK